MKETENNFLTSFSAQNQLDDLQVLTAVLDKNSLRRVCLDFDDLKKQFIFSEIFFSLNVDSARMPFTQVEEDWFEEQVGVVEEAFR